MDADPPCFLVINGDQLIYCQGRIAWYMQRGANLYWVTNIGWWARLPSPETLFQIHQADRQRLEAYLRTPQSVPPQGYQPGVPGPGGLNFDQTLPPIAPRPPAPRAPGTDYQELAEEIDFRAEEFDAEERRGRIWAKERTKEHNAEVRIVAERIAQRWRQRALSGAIFALARTDDHDYIEAMFALYSQGRRRLL